jgi:hypothetical protein
VSASAKYPFCKTFFQRLNRFNSYSERGIRELEEERNSNNSKTKQKQKSREEKSRAAKYRIAFLDNRLLAFVWQ